MEAVLLALATFFSTAEKLSIGGLGIYAGMAVSLLDTDEAQGQ